MCCAAPFFETYASLQHTASGRTPESNLTGTFVHAAIRHVTKRPPSVPMFNGAVKKYSKANVAAYDNNKLADVPSDDLTFSVIRLIHKCASYKLGTTQCQPCKWHVFLKQSLNFASGQTRLSI